MAIFPHLILENKVQVGDKTRLDATKSFVTADEDAISLLRIKPSDADDFIDVTTNKTLDWIYSSDGTKNVTTEVTAGASIVTGVPEITTVQTIADDSDGSAVVWDVLEAGIIDEGNGGFSAVAGTTTDFTHVIKATGHGAAIGEDFLLTYTFNGLAINNSISLVGLSNNTNPLDYGSNQIFGEMKPGTGTFRFFYETALQSEPAITYATSNTLEFKRVGTVFTLKVDGVLVFTDPTMQNTAYYPMARPMGIDVGVYTSTIKGGGVGINDTYFLYNTTLNDYSFYINVDAAGVAPAVATVEISVPVSAGDSANDVATALQVAMNGVTEITASSALNVVTATNASKGVVTDSSDVDSGFTISTTQQGTADVGEAPTVKVFTIEVISEVDDCLFSNDSMLVEYEGEILKYVRNGRFSWIDKHRAAQERIIEFLDENEIWKRPENTTVPVPYSKVDICALTGDDFEQFKDWSRFMVLEMIYFDMKKQSDDMFTDKFLVYKRKRIAASNRSVLRLDKDGSGTITPDEFEFKNQGRIIRR